MSACIFCGEHAGSSIKVPHDYISNLSEFRTHDEIIVDLPACTECREALDEVAFQSVEGAAGYLSSIYQERYQHLLSGVKWSPGELNETGHNLRSSIEISAWNQLEISARIEHCNRVNISGPDISEDLQDDLKFQILNNQSDGEHEQNDLSADPTPLATAPGRVAEKTTFDDPNSTVVAVNSLPNNYDEYDTQPTSRDPDPQVTLGELIIYEDTSVRLTNCVERSALSGLTVSKALQMGPLLDAMCQRIPAMGRKTIRELHELLVRFSQNPSKPRHDKGSERSNLLYHISRIYADVSMSEMIEALDASVRLGRGIESGPPKDQPLGQLLVEWTSACADLLKIPNFGRTSLRELQAVSTNLIHAHLTTCGLTENDSSTICALLFNSKAVESEDCAQLVQKLARLSAFNFNMLRSTETKSPELLTKILLDTLDERSRDIVKRRYALNETLEQIAERYALTRERIRQIESKALRQMAQQGKNLRLTESLIANEEEIWTSLVGDNSFLNFADPTSGAVVTPSVRLLMDIQGLSTTDLLNLIALRWEDGWCRLGTNTHAFDQAKSELQEALSGKPLPRPLPLLPSGSTPEITRMAAEVGLGMRTFNGYVLSDGMATRSQIKMVNLHRHMGNGRLPRITTLLARMLGGAQGRDSTSARYVAMLMERYPHLFLEADEGHWFGIGGLNHSDTEQVISPSEPPSDNDEYDDDTFTTAGLLREILTAEGPTTFSRLVEIASDRLPPGRSAASLGPTLIVNPDVFVRILPGVYGLKDKIPSAETLLEEKPKFLLNEEQARYYALGRRAGEPWDTFPLWSAGAEAALCVWAMHNADETIMLSLVSVATFDAWPFDEETKQTWRDLAKERNARFHLHFQPRDSVGYVLPKLDRLLAACLEARSRGQFNWMAGNRILKRLVSSNMSAGLMALMSSLDALNIHDATHWQMPHLCGSNLERLIQLLSDELHNKGSLDWSCSLGRRILVQASKAIEQRLGWIDRHLLAAMLKNGIHDYASSEVEFTDFTRKAIEVEMKDLQWTTAEVAMEPSRSVKGRGLNNYSVPEVTSARIVSKDEGQWTFDDE
jgi:hypothetical protein